MVYFVGFIFCGYMTQSEELLGHMELLFCYLFIFLETRFFFFLSETKSCYVVQGSPKPADSTDP